MNGNLDGKKPPILFKAGPDRGRKFTILCESPLQKSCSAVLHTHTHLAMISGLLSCQLHLTNDRKEHRPHRFMMLTSLSFSSSGGVGNQNGLTRLSSRTEDIKVAGPTPAPESQNP